MGISIKAHWEGIRNIDEFNKTQSALRSLCALREKASFTAIQDASERPIPGKF